MIMTHNDIHLIRPGCLRPSLAKTKCRFVTHNINHFILQFVTGNKYNINIHRVCDFTEIAPSSFFLKQLMVFKPLYCIVYQAEDNLR